MEDASKIMYKIANVLNWIALAFGVIFIILSIVLFANPNTPVNNTTDPVTILSYATELLIIGLWYLILPFVLIIITRIAYKKDSSQNWDILFLVLGVLTLSLFYFLGGLFGIMAKNKN